MLPGHGFSSKNLLTVAENYVYKFGFIVCTFIKISRRRITRKEYNNE